MPSRLQQLDRRPQVGGGVADVGTEAEVADPLLGHAASSRLRPRSRARSWVTSTATSWIASGSGGSGLAARTRTDSQP